MITHISHLSISQICFKICCYIWIILIVGLVIILYNYPKDQLDDDLAKYNPFPSKYSRNYFDFMDKSNYRKKIEECPWVKRNFTLHYDYSKDVVCKRVIRYANALNLTYFLAFGSELQAYRNSGIFHDHDIDIIIPIWMNPQLFNCSDFIPINRKKYNFNSIIIDHRYRLCGRRRRHYYKRFLKYIKKRLGYYDIGLYSYSLHIYMDDIQPFLDVWLMMSNEYVYDRIHICRCEFCGIETYCTRNIIENIVRNYDEEFMTPKSMGNDDPFIIPKPN